MTPDVASAEWRKASRSQAQGSCVEVATNLPGVVLVRDSKDPDGPALVFTPDEWDTFRDGATKGEFHI